MYKSAYEDSNSCTDSDIDLSCVSSQVPSTHSYKAIKNVVNINESVARQEL